MEEIKALLEKWARLEPRRCYVKTYQSKYVGYVIHGEFESHEFDGLPDENDNLFIEATIRQACEAKGYHWKIGCEVNLENNGKKLYTCQMEQYTGGDGFAKPPVWQFYSESFNLSVAMLECWLMVLHDKN